MKPQLNASPSTFRPFSAVMWRAGSGACLVAAAVLLSACGSTVKLNDKPAEAAPAASQAQGAGSSSTAVASVQTQPQDKSQAVADLPKAIYFDFDSYVVKDEFHATVEGYAKRLTADSKLHMRLEGHTDERGGSEYNLALGQKRADAVGKALGLLGVKPNQLETVSFGKERPAVEGHDEEAWAKNRRVEFK